MRNPTNWTYSGVQPLRYTDRGYTTHEHMSGFNLINMNGRMYDPVLGRMLSPDIIVGNAQNTQSYNLYSYVNNNPLKRIYPSVYRETNLASIAEHWITSSRALQWDSYNWYQGIASYGEGRVRLGGGGSSGVTYSTSAWADGGDNDPLNEYKANGGSQKDFAEALLYNGVSMHDYKVARNADIYSRNHPENEDTEHSIAEFPGEKNQYSTNIVSEKIEDQRGNLDYVRTIVMSASTGGEAKTPRSNGQNHGSSSSMLDYMPGGDKFWDTHMGKDLKRMRNNKNLMQLLEDSGDAIIDDLLKIWPLPSLPIFEFSDPLLNKGTMPQG